MELEVDPEEEKLCAPEEALHKARKKAHQETERKLNEMEERERARERVMQE